MALHGKQVLLRGDSPDAVHGRLRKAASMAEALDGAVHSQESVPERLEVKQSVLRAISQRTPKLIASNTSAMSIDQLSSFVAEPENFLGMHFFNPVWSLPLVEIIRGNVTGDAALASARAYAEANQAAVLRAVGLVAEFGIDCGLERKAACLVAGGYTLLPPRSLGQLVWGQWLGWI